MFTRGSKNTEQTFITKPAMSPNAKDLAGFRRRMAFKMFTSETKGNEKKRQAMYI